MWRNEKALDPVHMSNKTRVKQYIFLQGYQIIFRDVIMTSHFWEFRPEMTSKWRHFREFRVIDADERENSSDRSPHFHM